MVRLRGSQVHQWVVTGVAVAVLAGGEGIRAQSPESVHRAGYDALVSVPVQTGDPGDVEGDSIAITPGLPSNLLVPASHLKLVRTMWEQSPTFRRQCQRIGSDRTLTVQVHASPRTLTFHAATRLVQRRGSGIAADIYLAKLDRVVELLAHELEHIIERVEGIDVSQLTRRVPHLVWATANGTYETSRAIYSGQTVASEVAMAQK